MPLRVDIDSRLRGKDDNSAYVISSMLLFAVPVGRIQTASGGFDIILPVKCYMTDGSPDLSSSAKAAIHLWWLVTNADARTCSSNGGSGKAPVICEHNWASASICH
ncbi:MAG: hypothetical protein NTW07_02000, partial [candidate division Zixibacteria bacterium]|nr:hypothetical protein [candidate division Zixibacteria bacterium]